MSEQNSKSNFVSISIYWVIFVLAVGSGVAIIISNRSRPRSSPDITCINNLRVLDGAANQFALENGKTNGDRINFPDDLKPYLYRGGEAKTLICPLGGTDHLDKVGESPTCSLSNTVSPAHVLLQ